MLQSPSQTPELALFDVVITEFEARAEAPVSRIVRVFGVDEPTAQALVAALPAMVCQAVNQARAAHFARALVSIGARIDVRNRAGELVEVAELLGAVRSSREVPAERTPPANDNDVPAPIPASPTLIRGSDAFAATIGATPTPAPRAQDQDIERLQHEPTAPRIAPAPTARAAAGWGELQRDPSRARAPSQPLAAMREQLSSELVVPGVPGGPGPREFAAQDEGQRLSLEPQPRAPARAGSQPLTAAGQHPAMRGMSRPLSGQLSQPLTAAEFIGRPAARAAREAEAPAPPAPTEEGKDWSDVGLPELQASAATDDASEWMLGNAPDAEAPSLGSATKGQGPRLDALDVSGPALSLDPRAVRAVASRAGVTYEAGPGRARKDDPPRAVAPRVRGESAALGGAAARAVDPANARVSAPRARGESAALGGAAARAVDPANARVSAPRARGESAALGGAAARAVDPANTRVSAPRARGESAGLRGSGERGSARGDDDSAVQRGSAAGRARDDSAAVRAGAGAEAARAAANGGEAARDARARPADASLDADSDDNDFWESFTDTLAFPFRGSGIAWLVSIGVWAICASVLTVLALTAVFAGLSVMVFANTSVLALCADYHRHCMWAVADHDGMLVHGPEFDPKHIMQEYVRGGVHVTAFAVLSQLPLALWLAFALGHDGTRLLDVTFSARFWALAALPSLYWPMAVATASLYNRGAGVWFLPVGIRAIVRAPLMYFAVFAAGALTFLVPWLVLSAVAREAGIPGSLMLAIAGLPLAASHGVMGALTGLLMRSKSNLFG